MVAQGLPWQLTPKQGANMGIKKVTLWELVGVVLLISACGVERQVISKQTAPPERPQFDSYVEYRTYVQHICAKASLAGNVTVDSDSILEGDQAEALDTAENLLAVFQKYDFKNRGYRRICMGEKREVTNLDGVVTINFGATVDEIVKFLAAQPTKVELAARQVKAREDSDRRAAAAAEEAKRRAEANRPRREDFGRP